MPADGEHGGLVDLRIIHPLEQVDDGVQGAVALLHGKAHHQLGQHLGIVGLVHHVDEQVFAALVIHPAQDEHRVPLHFRADLLFAGDDFLQDGQGLVRVHAHQGFEGGHAGGFALGLVIGELVDFPHALDLAALGQLAVQAGQQGLAFVRDFGGFVLLLLKSQQFDGHLQIRGPVHLVPGEGLPVQGVAGSLFFPFQFVDFFEQIGGLFVPGLVQGLAGFLHLELGLFVGQGVTGNRQGRPPEKQTPRYSRFS